MDSQVKLFRSVEDRNLWIRLNAERIIEAGRKKNNRELPMGAIGAKWTAMNISNNQLMSDENRGELRFSMEELSSLQFDELDYISVERQKETKQKLFCGK